VMHGCLLAFVLAAAIANIACVGEVFVASDGRKRDGRRHMF
jgi:hypothetical protein